MRIILISDDENFFEYIIPKLMLRKSDELFRFKFDELPEKVHLISNSVLMINSECSEAKTLELLQFVNDAPSIVFAYNDNDEFRIKTYKAGAMGFVTMLSEDEEIQAILLPALNLASTLEKNSRYRKMLVKSNLLTPNNEVFLDYASILDKELEKLSNGSASAVLAAISPDDKTKFLLQPNQIETSILNNIRKNDILMSYAPNKYFLILYDTDLASAKKIWVKISETIPEKIYAGFVNITSNKKRQQIINEVLNKLHEAINCNEDYVNLNSLAEKSFKNENFKLYRQEFYKNFQNVLTPVFYQIQQKYNDKLFLMKIEQKVEEGLGVVKITGRHASGMLRITAPGLSKINIDITYSQGENTNAKRITLEPDELEKGLVEDLLEQFVIEFKKEINDDIN